MAGVNVRGLKELDRALGKADKTLRKDLRGRLREAAGVVAVEARAIAESKGLRQSGDLIRAIRPFVRSGSAGVRSGATHRGFAYPKRLEYGPGNRAHLNPAVDRKEAEIYERMETLLDEIERDFN